MTITLKYKSETLNTEIGMKKISYVVNNFETAIKQSIALESSSDSIVDFCENHITESETKKDVIIIDFTKISRAEFSKMVDRLSIAHDEVDHSPVDLDYVTDFLKTAKNILESSKSNNDIKIEYIYKDGEKDISIHCNELTHISKSTSRFIENMSGAKKFMNKFHEFLKNKSSITNTGTSIIKLRQSDIDEFDGLIRSFEDGACFVDGLEIPKYEMEEFISNSKMILKDYKDKEFDNTH